MPKITKKCKYCGKEFKVFPYKKDKAKYCSRSCNAKDKIAGWNKEKHLSEEHKKALSKSHTGKKLSEEHRKKISKSLEGNKFAYIDGRSSDPEWRNLQDRKKTHKRRNYNPEGSFTLDEWENLKEEYNYTCLMCGQKEPFKRQYCKVLTPDHVVPLAKGGTNYIKNIQPLCMSCNSRKNDKTIDFRDNFHAERLSEETLVLPKMQQSELCI